MIRDSENKLCQAQVCSYTGVGKKTHSENPKQLEWKCVKLTVVSG